ncbi:hypothetical protein KI387_001639, partial [Taxus chinensis]
AARWKEQGRDMGGDPCRVEPMLNWKWKDDRELWSILQIGGFTNFLVRVHGYDSHISNDSAKNWKDTVVRIKGYAIEITEDLIALVTSLSMDDMKYLKKKCSKEEEERHFLKPGEQLVPIHGGYLRYSFRKPYDEVSKIIIKYITLEGRFHLVHSYQLLFLNHFRHKSL